MAELSQSIPGQGPLESAIKWLEHAIWSGELKPGERVAESTIATKFGVGRGPLREALRTLEGRRLLERTPFSGVRVTKLSDQDLQQLLVTREALEGMAARQAAEVMTLPQIRQLREVLARTRTLNSVDEYFLQKSPDSDFHMLIAQGSGNRWLADFLCNDMYSLLNIYRYRAACVPERIAVVRDEHEEILEAIARREPDLAERLMREHIAKGRESLVRRMAGARSA